MTPFRLLAPVALLATVAAAPQFAMPRMPSSVPTALPSGIPMPKGAKQRVSVVFDGIPAGQTAAVTATVASPRDGTSTFDCSRAATGATNGTCYADVPAGTKVTVAITTQPSVGFLTWPTGFDCPGSTCEIKVKAKTEVKLTYNAPKP
jgi:hypothetical protein